MKEYPDTEAALEARFVLAQVKLKTGNRDDAFDDLTLLAGQDLPEKLKAKVVEAMEKLK